MKTRSLAAWSAPMALVLGWVLPPDGLLAQSATPSTETSVPGREIQWRPVEGASGYLVQIESEQGLPVLEQESATTHFSVSLPAGSYRVRVSALNRFGRPAAWSDWFRFEVSEVPPPGQEFLELQFQWAALVPGLVAFRNEEYWRSSFWWTASAFLLVAGFQERRRGSDLSFEAESRNPFFAVTFGTGQLAAGSLLLLERADLRARYDRSQATQRNIGYIGLLLYGLQILDACLVRAQPDQVQPIELGFSYVADPAAVGARSSPGHDQRTELQLVMRISW